VSLFGKRLTNTNYIDKNDRVIKENIRRRWTENLPVRYSVKLRGVFGHRNTKAHAAEQADEIHNFNFNWWNTLPKILELFSFKTM